MVDIKVGKLTYVSRGKLTVRFNDTSALVRSYNVKKIFTSFSVKSKCKLIFSLKPNANCKEGWVQPEFGIRELLLLMNLSREHNLKSRWQISFYYYVKNEFLIF